jgi:glycosyltransferase involved in cell wall biosynthesis
VSQGSSFDRNPVHSEIRPDDCRSVQGKDERNTDAPLITIGMTCFNAADTIVRAVSSALQQDWPKKEILIVDDASTDDSEAILKGLAYENPEIRLFRHSDNRGLPGAQNTIINSARGEFIAMFDDDDESAPHRLKEQWYRITAYEQASRCELVLCYSNRNVVKNGEATPDHVAKAIGRHGPEPHGVAVADYVLGNPCQQNFVWGMFGSCTLMARRTTFLAIGPFDEHFRRCAEWDLAVRAAFKDAHFIAVDQPLITQYKTPGAEKSGNKPLYYSLSLREKYKDYLSGRLLYRASRAMARARFHGGKGRILRSRAYALLACLSSPVFFWQKIASRLGDAPVEGHSRSL